MRGMNRYVALMMIMIIALTGNVSAGGETAQEVLEKVRKKYDSINDAELKFSQTVKFAMTKIEQHVNGTLFIKKGNKYRVELEEQTIVTNGETVWSYSVPNNQVLIDHFKMDERSLSPERILVGAPKDYAVTLVAREKVGKTDAVVLKLVPKTDQSFVKSMKLWVDDSDWLIKKVDLADVNGKETSYLVSEVRVNVGLQDSRFTYQIPDGIDVVDLR